MPKYADPSVYPVGTPAATDNVMTRTAAGADGNFALGNLAGIAGLTAAADLSLYYNGSAWATYTVTSVGRTLLAATTQAAQRTALALGTVATFDQGNSGNTIPHCNSTVTWGNPQTMLGNLTISNGGPSLFLSHTNGNLTRFWNPGTALTLSNTLSGTTTNYLVIDMASSIVYFRGNSVPAGDNLYSSGQAGNRWSQVYAVNGTINTSDARLKTEPRQLSDAECKAGSELARLPAIWEWLTGDRLHAGPTVQAAIAVMEAHGLEPFAYSFICYDEWEAEAATHDDEGNELTPAREAGDLYSFRKEELLCFMVSALAAENDVQAGKIEALDARLSALEAKV